MTEAVVTHSKSEEIACPSCGARIRDLWDYDWGTRESMVIDCDGCEKKLLLKRTVSVDYECSVAKPS